MRRRSPVFLARRAYRLRRLRDAARLLPLAGSFLLLLPILWEPVETAEITARNTAWDGIYLFWVWGLLIGLAAWLAQGLVAGEEGDADSPPETQSDIPAEPSQQTTANGGGH